MSLLDIARRRSAWVYHLSTGPCAGVDGAIQRLRGQEWDLERHGFRWCESPRHADIVLLTGPFASGLHDSALRVLDQVPGPCAVVAAGDCSLTGCVFAGSPEVGQPEADTFPIDITVPGCPPTMEAILTGLRQAAELLAAPESAPQPVAEPAGVTATTDDEEPSE